MVAIEGALAGEVVVDAWSIVEGVHLQVLVIDEDEDDVGTAAGRVGCYMMVL